MKNTAEFLGYIKVPFDFETEEETDHYDLVSALEFPKGWDFSEYYCSPIASVIIFECDHLPTEEEIQTIEKTLRG
jgi:hypothetical protein